MEQNEVIVIDDNHWGSSGGVQVSLLPAIDLRSLSFVTEPKCASRDNKNDDIFKASSKNILRTLLLTSPSISDAKYKQNAENHNSTNEKTSRNSAGCAENLNKDEEMVALSDSSESDVILKEEPVDVIDIVTSEDEDVIVLSDDEAPKEKSKTGATPSINAEAAGNTTFQEKAIPQRSSSETVTGTETHPSIKTEAAGIPKFQEKAILLASSETLAASDVTSSIKKEAAGNPTYQGKPLPQRSSSETVTASETVPLIKTEVTGNPIIKKEASRISSSDTETASETAPLIKTEVKENPKTEVKENPIIQKEALSRISSSDTDTASNVPETKSVGGEKDRLVSRKRFSGIYCENDKISSEEEAVYSVPKKKRKKSKGGTEKDLKMKTVTVSRDSLDLAPKKRKILIEGLNTYEEISAEIKRIIRASRQNATRYASNKKCSKVKKKIKKKFKSDEKRNFLCAHCIYQTNRRVDIKVHLVVRHNKFLFSRNKSDLIHRTSITEYFCFKCPYRTVDLNKLNTHSSVHLCKKVTTKKTKNETIKKTKNETTKKTINETTKKTINETTKKTINETTKNKINETTKKTINETTKNKINETTKKTINETTKNTINETTKKTINETTKTPKNVEPEVGKIRLPPGINEDKLPKTVVVLEKMKIHSCMLCSFKAVNDSIFNEHISKNHPPRLNIKSADPVYRCDYCSFETLKASFMNRHLRKVHKLPASYFPCGWCNAEFDTNAKLDEHCVKMHKKKKSDDDKQARIVLRKSILKPKLECNFCKQIFTNLGHLEKHLFRSHKCIGPVKCTVCGHSSRNVRDLQVHFSGHGNFVFCCTLCKFRDSSRNVVEAHISSDHAFVRCDTNRDKKNKAFPCKFCDYEASTLEGLKSHVSKEHPSDDLFSCNFCPRLFKEKSTLLKHTRDKHQNHKSEKYKCDQCNFVSKRGNFGLRKHIQMKHKSEFHCEFCEYSAAQEISVKMHFLKVHQSARPQRYTCPYCNFSCVTSPKLKNHIIYKHALNEIPAKSLDIKVKAEKKVECPVKKCKSEGFPHRRAMYDHLREKHNIKWKFHCEHCEFGTNSLRALSSHISSEHWNVGEDPPIKIFNCVSCKFNSKSIYRFINHIDKFHQSKWNFSRKDHIFKCNSCGFTANNTRTINLHIAKNHESTYLENKSPSLSQKKTFVYNCEDCDYKTNRLNSFEKHAKSHLSLENDTFTCPHCSNVFSSAKSLQVHLSNTHFINKSLLYVAKNYCSKVH